MGAGMTSKRTAKWCGSRAITEHPESGDWDFSNSEDACTRVYEGPYAALLSSRPSPGQVMAGMPAGFAVDRVKVKRAKSGKGTMTITLARTNGGSSDNSAPEQPQYEIDWSEVQKPLEQHPIWKSGAVLALADSDWCDIGAWKEEKDAALRKLFKYRDERSGSIYPLLTNARAFAAKALAGTTSYSVWIPVLRRTTAVRRNISGAVAGRIATPPDEFGTLPVRSGGGSYVWFKTADRSSRSGKHGKWRRIEEWTGFDTVDTDLYQ